MKRKISKIVASVLVVMLIVSQLAVPAFATTTVEFCTCATPAKPSTPTYTKAATCTKDGYNFYNCETCGKTIEAETDTVPATGAHTFNGEHQGYKAETCTEDGAYASAECSVCHGWGIDADYTEAGKYLDDPNAYTFVGADKTEATKINKTNHATKQAIPEETAICNKDGWKAFEWCPVCNTDLTNNKKHESLELAKKDAANKISAPDSHTWSATAVSQVDPTCIKTGTKAYYICENACGAVSLDGKVACTEADLVIPRVVHKMSSEKFSEQTCTTDEQIKYTCIEDGCANKGATFVEITKEKTNHANKTVIKEQAPTCTVDGWKSFTWCPDCNCVINGSTATNYPDLTAAKKADGIKDVAPGHKEYYIGKIDATCTTEGYTDLVKCAVCDETLSYESKTEALNHKFDNEQGAVAPECTKEGNYKYYKCTNPNCNEVSLDGTNPTSIENTKIPATRHSLLGTGTVDHTCTENGKITYVCTNVNNGVPCAYAESKDNPEDPAAHTATQEVEAKTPKCEEKGMNAFTWCDDCKNDVTNNKPYASLDEAKTANEIKALEHDYKDVEYVAPEYGKSGNTAGKKCQRDGCGDMIDGAIIPALNEKVNFAVAVKGGAAAYDTEKLSDTAVTTGFVYVTVSMAAVKDAADVNNKPVIARIGAADVIVNFDNTKFKYVGIQSQAFDQAFDNKTANTDGFVKVVQANMSADKIITDTAENFVVLKFKVKSDASGNADFTIEEDTNNISRMGTYEGTSTDAVDTASANITINKVGDNDGSAGFTTGDITNATRDFQNMEFRNDYSKFYKYDMDKDGFFTLDDIKLIMSAVAGNNDYESYPKAQVGGKYKCNLKNYYLCF